MDAPRLDYEADRNMDGVVDAADRTYEIVVIASDGPNQAKTIVTIMVTNVDEPPEFPETEYVRFIPENVGPSNVGPPVAATDPEGHAIKYTLDDTNTALFEIDSSSGQLKTKADGLDHEANETGTRTVMVTAEANPNPEKHKKVTVTVTVIVGDVSEPPAFNEPQPIERTIQESTAEGDNGTVVEGAVSATDPDGGDPRYTLKPSIDADSFEIDRSTGDLTPKVVIDFEADRNNDGRRTSADWIYTVTVIATDGSGLSSEAEVVLTVINLPEAPMFPVTSGSVFVYEGQTKVWDPDGVLIATDGDGDPLTYTLGDTHADKFTINNLGQLTLKQALDFDAVGVQKAFAVTVSVTDESTSVSQFVMIELRDITEVNNVAPRFYKTEAYLTPITTQTVLMVEENAVGHIGTVYAKDENGDKLLYTLSGSDIALFTIGSDGSLSSKKPLDFDRRSSYTVVVTAYDGTTRARLSVTITGTDINEAPQFVDEDGFPIPSTERSITEGRSGRNIGEPVLAMDPDLGDRLTYTLDPDSEAIFSYNRTSTGVRSTGVQLRAKAVLDHEDKASYTVTITVRDSKDDDNNPDTDPDNTITVTVMVTNVNEKAKFVKTAIDIDRIVPENSAAGTTVGDAIVAIDPEGDPLTYTLRNANTARVPFQIGESTGQLTTTAALDYETQKVYTVTVDASDRKDTRDRPVADTVNDYDATVAIRITVDDVDETTNRRPRFINASGTTITRATRTIPENTAASQPIGAPVEATDDDGTDIVTYTIDTASEQVFAIDATTGQLKTKAALDYEADRNNDESVTSADFTYEVIVTATDPGRPDDTPKGPKLSATLPVTITVTDVNEPPIFPPATDGVYVYEGDAGQEVIDSKGALMAEDKDAGDTFTYSIDANSRKFFVIDANTGTLTTKVPLEFDGDPAPTRSYPVTVTATDAAGLFASQQVTIDLKNVSGDETGETNTPPVFVTSATDDAPLPSVDRGVEEHVGEEMDAKNVGEVILAKDADDDTTLTYTLGGADADFFTVQKVATGVQLKTATEVVLDYEIKTEYMVTITVSDGNTADDTTITVNIGVTDVSVADGDTDTDTVPTNTAPVFDETGPITHSISPDTAVGSEVGGPLAVTDPDMDTLTYAISGGNTAGLFEIDTSTGQLTTAAAVPAGSHELTVTVSDGKAADDTADPAPDATITVTITVENTAPAFDAGESVSLSISPDTAVGSNVGEPLAVTDSDMDTLTYAISEGNIAGLFTIDDMGQLTTALAVTAGSHELTVTVSDGKAADDTADPAPDATITVTITVGNVSPTFDAGESVSFSIPPDTTVGSNVGEPLAVTDPDESDTLTYAISSGNTDELFEIDDTGQLTTAAAVPAGTYELMVTVSDGKASDDTADPAPDATITVTITVENTAPVFDETGPHHPLNITRYSGR